MSSLQETIETLQAGDLAVIPTDTVYGLAAGLSGAAISRIFEAKGRPESKPLPVLVGSLEQAESVAIVDDRARRLAQRFWPGPLTLVLTRAIGFDVDLGGDEKRTVAVRVPKHRLALDVLRAVGPLAVTSANLSGAPPAATISEARDAFGDAVAAYLDGGRCTGLPSTIVFLAGERRILREGALPQEQIAQMLKA